ncbi:unnamed protein product, partial [Boreogadus saida]
MTSRKTGHRVHAFPKDKATLRQWVQFVRVRRADFSIPSVTKNSKVCSAHFREEDYDQGDVRMSTDTISSSYRRGKQQDVRARGGARGGARAEQSKVKAEGTCIYCGEAGHGKTPQWRARRAECPAYGKTCRKCNRQNHLDKACLACVDLGMISDRFPTLGEVNLATSDPCDCPRRAEPPTKPTTLPMPATEANRVTQPGGVESPQATAFGELCTLTSTADM